MPAAATTFGTPLGTAPFNAPPTYNTDCSGYWTPFLGLTPVYSAAGPPNLATSCIWIHVPSPAEVSAAGGANISLEPPGTGTVTQVRVAVGATTGAMQVVVMRALYQNTATPGHPNDACCFPVARSGAFTPQANSIATVAVNLPVTEDTTPPPEDTTTIADFDTRGLAVLEPQVPAPLYFTGDYSAPADFLWNTAMPSTVTPGFYSDTGGFFVAMNADWTAAAPTGGAAEAAEPQRVAAVVGRAAMEPACRSDFQAPPRSTTAPRTSRCAASPARRAPVSWCCRNARLRGAQQASVGLDAAGSAAPKTTSYGHAPFKIAAGGHKLVKVHLSRAARALLAHHRSVTVWAIVKFRGKGAKSYETKLKLHR
jgi:hypothetical protein